MSPGTEASAPAIPDVNVQPAEDRRRTVAERHGRVAAWLRDRGCDRLLLRDPANVAWLTGGGLLRSAAGIEPALLVGPEQCWLLCGSHEAAALLDLEFPGLGLVPLTWPGLEQRQAVLDDACRGLQVASDGPAEGTLPGAPPLIPWRRELSLDEQKNLKLLGRIVAHAVEATCRTIKPDEAERDVAAQLSHRLLHRGTEPLDLAVAGLERARRHGCHGITAAPVGPGAVVRVTARRFGLHATASRSVSFGSPPEEWAREHRAACKVTGAYIASTWPDARPREIVGTGRRYCQLAGFDPASQLGPAGHLTGWAPVEMPASSTTDDLLQPGWAMVWEAGIGGALSADTFLVSPDGPKLVTPTEAWPWKRIRIQGMKLVRPDILQR